MSTKAERFKYESQRKGASSKSARSKAAKHARLAARHKKPTGVVESTHAARKAAFVLEDHPGTTRPSRLSTRKTSNHSKATASMEIRAENAGSSPEQRASRGIIARIRVRGRPASIRATH